MARRGCRPAAVQVLVGSRCLGCSPPQCVPSCTLARKQVEGKQEAPLHAPCRRSAIVWLMSYSVLGVTKRKEGSAHAEPAAIPVTCAVLAWVS